MFEDQFAEGPRTRAQLVAAIAERWPERDASSLGYAMYLVPTVQVTPRGIWGLSGASAFTTVERWLGRPIERSTEPDEMTLRYLAAFGPSAVGDAQSWSGLTGLKVVFERLRPRLRTFRDERGRELFDVPGAPLPDRSAPAPVRFLPEYDNVLLAHDDRSRIGPPGLKGWTEVGWGSVLVDGFGAARWRAELDRDRSTLWVEPFGKIARADRAEVAEEGDRLLGFLAPETDGRDVRFRTFRTPAATR